MAGSKPYDTVAILTIVVDLGNPPVGTTTEGLRDIVAEKLKDVEEIYDYRVDEFIQNLYPEEKERYLEEQDIRINGN